MAENETVSLKNDQCFTESNKFTESITVLRFLLNAMKNMDP